MTRRELLALALGAAVAVGAGACQKLDEAVDPAWGKQPCAHCAMLVSDKRYAAQVVADGDRKYFDDIGCMVLWTKERKSAPERAWVRAADRWVDAKGARYVSGAKTPMDFGFEASASGADGVGWDEMRDKVIAKGSAR